MIVVGYPRYMTKATTIMELRAWRASAGRRRL